MLARGSPGGGQAAGHRVPKVLHLDRSPVERTLSGDIAGAYVVKERVALTVLSSTSSSRPSAA